MALRRRSRAAPVAVDLRSVLAIRRGLLEVGRALIAIRARLVAWSEPATGRRQQRLLRVRQRLLEQTSVHPSVPIGLAPFEE